MKTCTKCGREKELPAFTRDKRKADGRGSWCQECTRASQQAWRIRTGWRQEKGDRRPARILKTYGLTPDAFSRMLEDQGGRCAACLVELETGSRNSKTSLAIDHNHETGKVRGLLCHRCNIALGMLDDDPTKLRALIDYLKERE